MTVGELKYLIEDTVRRYLFENVGHEKSINRNPIVEMARLNNKDAGAVPFPSNKFDIRIWSNDHLPPHFHVIADGWDISFLIEDGRVYRVNKIGKNSSTYTYIEKNVPIWLEMENSANKKITNKEFAELTWDSNHD